MKKVLICFVFLLVFLTSCNKLSSCRKVDELDYKYIGVYVKFSDEQISLNDYNLKLYIDPKTNKFCELNGVYVYKLTGVSITKPMYYEENGISCVEFGGSYNLEIIKEVKLDSLTIYPIIFKDGEISIKTDEQYEMKLSNLNVSTKTIEKRFKYNNIDSYLKIVLKVYKKEV